jgi:uncharacterized membrane protein YqhA
MDEQAKMRPLKPLPNLIFMSRWLQLPLYLGLIVAQAVYVWVFWQELYHLVLATMGNADSLIHVLDAVTVEGAARPAKPNETVLMLVVLGLIDVVMISNLLIMVIVGGYETFISKMGLEGHPDQPEWLSSVNASVLKVKARHRDHRHLVDPPPQDLHQRAALRRQGDHRAGGHPHHVPHLRPGDRGRRPAHAHIPVGLKASTH